MFSVAALLARNIFKSIKNTPVKFLSSTFKGSIISFCKPMSQIESQSNADANKVEIRTRKVPCFSQSAENINASKPTIGTPRPVKDPPEDYSPSSFTHQAFTPPPAVELKAFRSLCDGDELGPGASKSEEYKNPEYFSYHRYSFAEIMANTVKLRDNGPLKLKENEQKDVHKTEDVACENGKKKVLNHVKLNPNLPSTYCVPPLSPLRRNVKTYVVPIRRME